MRPRQRLAVALLMLPFAAAAAIVAEGWLRAPTMLRRHFETRPAVIDSQELPALWLRDLVAVEDPHFYHHHGADITTPGAGLTSITQGLVKFLYFERFRPGPFAKLRQTLLAIGFDARVDKETQLDLFLNSVYLGSVDGREVHGFHEAARAFYGKPLERLSRHEFLSLVAMCIAPHEFSPATRPEANAERVRRIENLLGGRCTPSGVRDVYYERCASPANP